MSNLFMNMQRARLGAGSPSVATPSTSTTTSTHNSFSVKNGQMDRTRQFSVVDANEQEENDALSNVLSLKLKKPKHWKWELSTSRSCSNIALPRILLYDHKGELLADVNSQNEQTVAQTVAQTDNQSPPRTSTRKRQSHTRAATSNLAQSIRQALDHEFSDLHIQEATPSPLASSQHTRSSSLFSHVSGLSTVDFYTYQLPDYKSERRSSSLKGVRFEERSPTPQPVTPLHVVDLPTPPSTSTTTTHTPTTASSGSGPREKRRYRRSRSSGRSGHSARSPATSSSILERFSFNKGRFSSPEYAEEHQVQHSPRYFLRTSKAGTLVVQEDSFSRCRRRRRPRHSSSENVHKFQRNTAAQNTEKPGSLLSIPDGNIDSFKTIADGYLSPQHGSLQSVVNTVNQRSFPLRRYRSDGSMLKSSTSEEDLKKVDKPRRRYAQNRRQSKKGLLTIDSDNGVQHTCELATGR